MKKPEIVQLRADEPELYQLALGLEDNYFAGQHWRGEEATTVGLGRKFSWRDVS